MGLGVGGGRRRVIEVFRSNKYRTWERPLDGLGGGVRDGGLKA